MPSSGHPLVRLRPRRRTRSTSSFVSGRHYAYLDVPEREVAAALRRATSKGSFFNRRIRDRYRFERR